MPAFDLERLAAEDEIARLIFAYCTGIDTGHLDDTAQLFADTSQRPAHDHVDSPGLQCGDERHELHI